MLSRCHDHRKTRSLDQSFSQKPHSPFEIYARVDNLFDARYYNIGGGGSSTFLLSPQDTRWVQFGIRLTR